MNQKNFFVPASVRRACPAGCAPARVLHASREHYRLYAEQGEIAAQLAGNLRYEARTAADLPVTGDWVFTDSGLIRAVAPRWSKFSRRGAGTRAEEQVLAANIDITFLVCGLDGDFNVRRLERYLVLTRESGADAVVVLSKSDLSPETLPARIGEARVVAGGAPVITASAKLQGGLDTLRSLLDPGCTAVLLGSSGAGKSSIVNGLLGEEALRTQTVREHDSRGRHTTTHRELFELPGGAFLIDTPGLREIQLWAEESSVDETFDEIAGIASGCRFSDCRHKGEPGCAVVAAIESGQLDEGRWRSYEKLNTEVRRMSKERLKQIHKDLRARYKYFGKKG